MTRRLSMRWICLRPPQQLKAQEEKLLQELPDQDSDLALGHRLLQEFGPHNRRSTNSQGEQRFAVLTKYALPSERTITAPQTSVPQLALPLRLAGR